MSEPGDRQDNPLEEGFHYTGFWVRLDCESCGSYIEIEGDVSNEEIYECEECRTWGKVWGR